MAAALPVLLCFASGFLVVGAFWRAFHARLLNTCLSAAYGIAVFSIVFFLSRIAGVRHLVVVDLVIFALILTGFLLLRTRAKSAFTFVSTKNDPDIPASFQRLLTAVFVLAIGVALYSAVLRAIVHPYGEGWDAFAIWNLHARFLFLGGSRWQDGFSPLIPSSHPDYPLLLPGAIAHFWNYLGHDTQAVPAILGMVFTFSTIGLLFSSLALLRSRSSAMLGGLALVSTPAFIELGTSQYADVPLGFFYLAAIVMLCLYDHCAADASSRPRGLLVLAGLGTGFSAWAKNEGLLFLFAVIAARLLIYFRARRHQNATDSWLIPAYLVLSIAPILLLIVWFKHSIAPPSDLFSDPGTTFHRVLIPARHWAILRWFAKTFFRFGHWFLIPGTLSLSALYLVARKDNNHSLMPGFRTSILALCLTLAGYFAVYEISPYNVYWHLRFSLSRLFLQLWPSVLFLFFAWLRFAPVQPRLAGSALAGSLLKPAAGSSCTSSVSK